MLEGFFSRLRKAGAPQASRDSMLSQYLLLVILATALPLCILISQSLWMATTYSNIIHLQAFLDQYYNGIYKYRILGRDILLHLYNFLQSHFTDSPYPLRRDPSATFLFYGALAISNGIYFTLSNLLLLLLIWVKGRGLPDRVLTLYFYYTILLALSMSVVTPYDQLAYLILMVGILGAHIKSSLAGFLFIGISAIAGILNRETEFLLVSFLATVALFSAKGDAPRYRRLTVFAFVVSVGTYVSARIIVPGKLDLIQFVTLGGKWAIESLFVVAMLLAAGTILAMRLYRSALPMLAFLIFSLPYLLTVFMGGVLRELRLTIPLLLCVMCLYILLSRSEEAVLYSENR